MFPNVSTEKVLELAEKVGRKMSREYPGVDASEISSEALLKLMEKSKKMDNPSVGYVYRVMERDGGAYAAKIRYEYVIATSQYIYTPREIKLILKEVYFDPSAWDVPSGKDDWLSAELEGRSIGISLIDIKEAMKRIKPSYKATLEDKYFWEKKVHPQKLSRAVDAITQSVNRIAVRTGQSDNCPGSRTAMSNAQMQGIATSYTEGGIPQMDPLEKLQNERKRERSHPPGTFYNWDKYNNN